REDGQTLSLACNFCSYGDSSPCNSSLSHSHSPSSLSLSLYTAPRRQGEAPLLHTRDGDHLLPPRARGTGGRREGPQQEADEGEGEGEGERGVNHFLVSL